MPPKAKFTREEIVAAALTLIREEGADALTSRAIGLRLGSSARPIFTVFESMDELRQAVIEAARALYQTYVQEGLSETPAFKGVGMQYVRFAKEEPRLFQLLFMTEDRQVPELSAVLSLIEGSYTQILSAIEKDYALGQKAAERLYRHLWIYTHGIAALCATKVCRFTDAEIGRMMSEVCVSVLQSIRGGKEND